MNVRIVTDYLERTVRKYPDKIAFSDEQREVTFQTVREEAQRVASEIIQDGFFKKPIAVFMDKQVECINAFLGVAYSGNYYTVLDTKMPIEKIMAVLEPVCIITDNKHETQANEFAAGCAILKYEELMSKSANLQIIQAVREKIVSTDILYVLFTSGSTGNPKGVIISHQANIAYLEWGGETFRLDDRVVFGNQTPFYFVMSGFDIYQTVRNGGTMFIIPKTLFSFPVMLLEYLKEKRINLLYWVPSALCAIANFRALPEVHLDDLKAVMFGGEVMPVKQLNMWRTEYPDVKFINQYGPTELTDICSYYLIERELDETESIPIGKKDTHMDVMILNENDEPVQEGEIGELCGRGPSLSYGYYNEPEKTKEVFVQNPLNHAYPELIYRTGDLVRYNDRGEILYVSRKDFQIKHLGHRIELGEIETAVSSLEEIEQNCCLYDAKRSKIVLFYVGGISEKELGIKIKDLLPEYMLPNKKIKMQSMPINLNGKIDRAKLKELLAEI